VISLDFEQLAKMVDGDLRQGLRPGSRFTGVSTDSRTLSEGQLFFAIRGDNHDGHRFIDQAVERGAAGIVIDRDFAAANPMPSGCPSVVVADSHASLLRLAERFLAGLDLTRIGITGSNGKTTTKEFAFRLLETVTSRVYRSPGNYNNLFGVPLALFEMPEGTEIAVLEMGISLPGEMERLATVVRPNLIVVTNVGPTHLEFLGTVKNVAREKLSAMKQAAPDGVLIVNGDDPLLVRTAVDLGLKPIRFALDADADFRPDNISVGINGTTVVTIEGHRFVLSLFGRYQISNLLAAYAAACTLGYSFEGVETEAIMLSTVAMRGEIINRGGITFISDCYNANPESVKAGLATLAGRTFSGRLVLILGDMLELGSDTARFHREAGDNAAQLEPDLLIGVGPRATQIVEGASSAGMTSDRLMHFDNAGEEAETIAALLEPGDTVYLKGSRGIGLEAILGRFAPDEGRA
jgi:UDP-N-acetylmuramoyl-tripeptide--D-alanyl-D-alanine ligase